MYRQALEKSIRVDGQSSLKKQMSGRGQTRPSPSHMIKLFAVTNAT